MMVNGKFREDLFFRLNVFYLFLPALRERKETIPTLAHLFIHRFNRLFAKNINGLSKSTEAILANYHYPGNIRELENIIEHAVVLAEGNEITEKDLPEFLFRNRLLITDKAGCDDSTTSGKVLTLPEMEKEHIKFVLGLTNFNYTEAAAKLDISRSTLWRKIKDYNIETK